MAYAQNQWPAMARYLEVAQAEIDNNSIEHALRGVVLGRRNWLHVGQETGGQRAANLFSLMISCKRLGTEPYAYQLPDVFVRMTGQPAQGGEVEFSALRRQTRIPGTAAGQTAILGDQQCGSSLQIAPEEVQA